MLLCPLPERLEFGKGTGSCLCLNEPSIISNRQNYSIIYVGDGCEAYSSNLFIPSQIRIDQYR